MLVHYTWTSAGYCQGTISQEEAATFTNIAFIEEKLVAKKTSIQQLHSKRPSAQSLSPLS